MTKVYNFFKNVLNTHRHTCACTPVHISYAVYLFGSDKMIIHIYEIAISSKVSVKPVFYYRDILIY